MPRAMKFAGVAAIGVACSGVGDGGKDASDDVHDMADATMYGDVGAPLDATNDVHADASDATVADASDASDADANEDAD